MRLLVLKHSDFLFESADQQSLARNPYLIPLKAFIKPVPSALWMGLGFRTV